MRDEDLSTFDLSAWEAPPPPAGLAEAVIARMREPVAATAVEAEAPARRAWLGAVVLAVVAAAVLVLVIARGGGERGGAPLVGAVVATQPRHLELATASADLDAGTIVTWYRDRDGLVVAQRRGAAAWHVRTGAALRIETGVAGTSVEATGASLRVEDPMNLSDARVIGASAVTAAAVAFVTVVVYEGHVKATSGGQTVEIQPGATLALREDHPPGPVPAPDRDDRPVPAGTIVVAPGAPSGDQLGGDAIHDGIAAIQAAVDACGTKYPASGIVKVHFAISPDGTVTSASVTETPEVALGACVAAAVRTARFAKSGRGASVSYPFSFREFAFDAPPPAACDADALEEKGKQFESTGNHAAALNTFETALHCRSDRHDVVRLAFMAACNSQNVVKAKLYFKRLAPLDQRTLAQLCVRVGITQDQLGAP